MEHAQEALPRKNDTGWHFRHRPLGLILIIAYKGIWGFLEFLAGIILLFSSRLIAAELLEDPQDVFLNWLVWHLRPDFSKVREVGIFICLLGGIKMFLAVGLWYRSYFMRSIGLVFLSLFAAFATTKILIHFSWFTLGALLMDLLILYYVWRILPKHFRHGEIV